MIKHEISRTQTTILQRDSFQIVIARGVGQRKPNVLKYHDARRHARQNRKFEIGKT